MKSYRRCQHGCVLLRIANVCGCVCVCVRNRCWKGLERQKGLPYLEELNGIETEMRASVRASVSANALCCERAGAPARAPACSAERWRNTLVRTRWPPTAQAVLINNGSAHPKLNNEIVSNAQPRAAPDPLDNDEILRRTVKRLAAARPTSWG